MRYKHLLLVLGFLLTSLAFAPLPSLAQDCMTCLTETGFGNYCDDCSTDEPGQCSAECFDGVHPYGGGTWCFFNNLNWCTVSDENVMSLKATDQIHDNVVQVGGALVQFRDCEISIREQEAWVQSRHWLDQSKWLKSRMHL